MTAPNIEIADDFFHDAIDFLFRYRLTFDRLFAIKSQRLKLFLDLRMAAECLLKAYAAYFLLGNRDRKSAIESVERYGHRVGQLAADVQEFIPSDAWTRFNAFVSQLDSLPVGLRYGLDGADFREFNEEFYYQTVGSDTWLDELHDVLRAMSDTLNAKLSSHSEIVGIADLLKRLEAPQYNKYSERQSKKTKK